MLALNDEATTANYTVVASPNQCSNVTISIPPIRPQSSPPVVALMVIPPPQRDPFHGADPRTPIRVEPIQLPATLCKAVLVLPLPALVADVGATAGPTHDLTFEYANQRLNALPTATRQRLTIAAENLLDHALAYLLGDEDRGSWATASSTFFDTVNRARKGKPDPEPRPLVPHVDPDPAVNQAGVNAQAARQADQAQRLTKLLADLDVHPDVPPTGPMARVGFYEYHLRDVYAASGGLIIKRRHPSINGAYLKPKLILTADQIPAALDALDDEFEAAQATTERRRSVTHPPRHADEPPGGRANRIFTTRADDAHAVRPPSSLEDRIAAMDAKVIEAGKQGVLNYVQQAAANHVHPKPYRQPGAGDGPRLLAAR